MRLLFAASEAAPWSKSGGLGDVCGALPRALAARGHQVLLVVPGYRGSIPAAATREPERHTLHFPFGDEGFVLHTLTEERLTVAFVDAPKYFDRPGLYGEAGGSYPDNPRRYAVFTMAALAAAQALRFEPQVVHLHDWQTGLGALALKRGFGGTALGRAACVFTVHNLAYQGVFPKSEVDALGLPWEVFNPDGVEFHDQLSFLKAGVSFCDHVTTVSPTYAKEILTPEGGFGLHGAIAARKDALRGILNGIDDREWDPQTDPLLPARFSKGELSGKEVCARALLQRFGLSLPPSARFARRPPIFGVVGRMAGQKGVDALQVAAPSLLARGARLVIVGTGEPQFENAWRALAAKWPGRLGVHIGFDEPLAHLVEAGSDFFLMPSRFEPCGLNQMYSQRYGTVPVVRGVGGLVDTVTDVGLPGATGIVFQGDAFAAALERALKLYADWKALDAVRAAGMAKDFSWNASAQAYERLYEGLVASRTRPAPPSG
jgi:starch synthase